MLKKKIPVNAQRKGEKGYALVLVLVALFVGSLTIAPVLAFIGNGTITGTVYERLTEELYAADAGVTDAMWQIKNGSAPGSTPVPPWPDYDLSADVGAINGQDVSYTMVWEKSRYWHVISTANSHTTIDAYVSFMSGLLQNAATSLGAVDREHATVNGPVEEFWTLAWPTFNPLYLHYIVQVDESDPYSDNPLDIKTEGPTIGPLYFEDNKKLVILNSGSPLAIAELGGVIYVKRNPEDVKKDMLWIGQGNQEFTLNLSDEAIFVEGAIKIGPQCTLTGTGCIIATGDIDFQPNIVSNPGDFIFVLSLDGEINAQPNGDFTGSFAGDVTVNLQPGVTLTWIEPPLDQLNFPLDELHGSGANEFRIHQWIIE